MLDLDAIQARAAAATPGDHWFADLEPEDQRCCAAFTTSLAARSSATRAGMSVRAWAMKSASPQDEFSLTVGANG